ELGAHHGGRRNLGMGNDVVDDLVESPLKSRHECSGIIELAGYQITHTIHGSQHVHLPVDGCDCHERQKSTSRGKPPEPSLYGRANHLRQSHSRKVLAAIIIADKLYLSACSPPPDAPCCQDRERPHPHEG